MVGGLLLGYINYWLLPDVLNNAPSKIGLNFQLTSVQFGIYGFLLVIVMILRPQGLIPERRRKLEMTAAIGAHPPTPSWPNHGIDRGRIMKGTSVTLRGLP